MTNRTASKTPVVLSMLHEPAGRNSATRQFRGRPVLRWTLDRLGGAERVGNVAILCWDDQRDAVTRAIGEAREVRVSSAGPRAVVPELEAVTAARRWSDGWRGGLLATCDFDQGFSGPRVREIVADQNTDAVLLVNPAAGLVDPALIDGVMEHADAHPSAEICFAPAAPGLNGVLLRRALLERLATARTHPGRVLHYLPDQISREPLAGESCAPVPTPVARTTSRFTLDSDRQLARLDRATGSLNGQLISRGAEDLVARVQSSNSIDPLPREVVLELNTARSTRAIFRPAPEAIDRPTLSTAHATALVRQLAAADDARLTLAGFGDPLLAANVFDVIAVARDAGVSAVHLETDLLGVSADHVARLAASAIDVVSVHVPATTPATYQAVMGVDALAAVLENVRSFVTERARRGRGVPLLVPVFTKCRQNLGEMEQWYDQWLRALGSAVIAGPSDYAGAIPDVGVADMSPPRRKPCARLASRLTVLSDGRVVSCEQDVVGRQAVGHVDESPLAEIWQRGFGALRGDHARSEWTKHPACAACKEWHRT